tara:strand:- start:459 stop:719 length:261 start_codon:yes stop_codon:yes gene_type:complete
MKARYRLTRRGSRGNTCYSVESATGNRTSLKTDNRRKAQRLVDATNEAEQPPMFNLQIAKNAVRASQGRHAPQRNFRRLRFRSKNR